MDTTLKLTKQGIRDLNSYGPRPKPVAADGSAPAEAGAMAVAEAPASEAVNTAVPAGDTVVPSSDAGSS